MVPGQVHFAPKRRERQAAAQAATGEQLDKKT
jgi:signal peptidase I